jgi:hypothetical protein
MNLNGQANPVGGIGSQNMQMLLFPVWLCLSTTRLRYRTADKSAMHATTPIVALEMTSVVQGEKKATNITNSAEMPAQSGLNVLSIADYAEHSVERAEV